MSKSKEQQAKESREEQLAHTEGRDPASVQGLTGKKREEAEAEAAEVGAEAPVPPGGEGDPLIEDDQD